MRGRRRAMVSKIKSMFSFVLAYVVSSPYNAYRHLHKQDTGLLGILLSQLLRHFSLCLIHFAALRTFIARSHLLPANAITKSGFPAKDQQGKQKGQFCFSSVIQFFALAKET